ncbi:hypothetical protein [Polynucleobacter necessarius]|uniref:hypothetical protein n=1 Tax=Polynucleobacter necessarius TaxID=576610 RepID=UPI0013B06D43|nr:hypothetical protein [Polynucleobacter necessarius]
MIDPKSLRVTMAFAILILTCLLAALFAALLDDSNRVAFKFACVWFNPLSLAGYVFGNLARYSCTFKIEQHFDADCVWIHSSRFRNHSIDSSMLLKRYFRFMVLEQV